MKPLGLKLTHAHIQINTHFTLIIHFKLFLIKETSQNVFMLMSPSVNVQ